jgi:hypothetical protein
MNYKCASPLALDRRCEDQFPDRYDWLHELIQARTAALGDSFGR